MLQHYGFTAVTLWAQGGRLQCHDPPVSMLAGHHSTILFLCCRRTWGWPWSTRSSPRRRSGCRCGPWVPVHLAAWHPALHGHKPQRGDGSCCLNGCWRRISCHPSLSPSRLALPAPLCPRTGQVVHAGGALGGPRGRGAAAAGCGGGAAGGDACARPCRHARGICGGARQPTDDEAVGWSCLKAAWRTVLPAPYSTWVEGACQGGSFWQA